MKDRFSLLFAPILLSLILLTACGAGQSQQSNTNGPSAATSSPKPLRVREPAVAGLFYPKGASELSKMIDSFLKQASSTNIANVRAIICPHAGYPYSGPTAAFSYKLVQGQTYSDVIILAPSHYAGFEGASVLAKDVFRTPLGDVPVSSKGQQVVKSKPFRWEPQCLVQRPAWASQSSRPMPASGEETPDTWEHSDEVQVPFLQRVLKDFKVLTVVLGEVDPAAVARGLEPVLDDKTLLVVSSDLSHYHAYEQAKQLDERCVKAVCDLDISAMEKQEACGNIPIIALLHLAREKGWKPLKLDYRNSGDTAGDKTGVVGYSAIAFYAPTTEKPEKAAANFSLAERKFLMSLAKNTVREIVLNGKLPVIDEKTVPAKLKETKGCFVTLTKGGELRGCIGHIIAQEPLYQAIIDNARSAATRDPRFMPVQGSELAALEFEISVLTAPQPLAFSSSDDLLKKLRPHIDGVVLQIGRNTSTFLPQVWEQLPDPVEFLNHLARKGGSDESDWRSPGTKVSIYQVECFKESEL